MRDINNPLSGFRPAPQHEVDREMEACFAQFAAEKQAAAAIRAAQWRKADKALATKAHTGLGPLPLNAETEGQRGIGADKVETTGDPELDRMLAALADGPKSDSTSSLVKPTHKPDTVTAGEPDTSEITEGAAACETVEPVAAPVAKSCMPVVGAAEDSFPVHDGDHLSPKGEPAVRLQVLCSELARHHDYRAIRAEYCELSVRLNLVGRLAPAFRPELRAGGLGPVYQLIHRDQLVIDMHWCHTQRFSLSPIEHEHAALFQSDRSFSFTEAWALANRKWKDKYRAGEALCLTTFQQCQLRTLRDEETATRIKGLTVGYRDSEGKTGSKVAKAKRAIAEWVGRDRRLKPQQHIYEQLWLARELLGHGASSQQIADLLALMSGTSALDRRTVTDKVKKLDKAIASI